MKKVTVVARDDSNGFAGKVELLYGLPRVGTNARPLIKIDVSGAELSDAAHGWFFDKTPRWYGVDYLQMWGKGADKILISEEEYELDFDLDFWGPYGHKLHKDRAQREWAKMSAADRILAVASISQYFRYCAETGYRAKVLPHKYLNQKYYKENWRNAQ